MGGWRRGLAALLTSMLLASAAAIGTGLPAAGGAMGQPASPRDHERPEEALAASLHGSLQAAGTPYRNVQYVPLSEDDTVARFRVVVEFRPDAERAWEENERVIEVRRADESWQEPHIPPYYAWSFTQAERARRARLVRVEVLQTRLAVDSRERAVDVPVRLANDDTWGYASIYFRATFRDAAGRLLQGPSGEVAWEAGAGPYIVAWGSTEELSIRLYLDPALPAGSLPPTVQLVQHEVRLGRAGEWETRAAAGDGESS